MRLMCPPPLQKKGQTKYNPMRNDYYMNISHFIDESSYLNPPIGQFTPNWSI